MPRHHFAKPFTIAITACGLLGSSTNPRVLAQTTVATSGQTAATKPLVTQIAEALTANPLTAPYSLTVEQRKGQVALRGRVGSKVVHDAAVRTAITFGVSVVDDLVIDTSAAAAVLPQGPNVGLPLNVSSYTYPPPLFGRFDDPFFGFEPPLMTYPPWWGEMSQYRLGQGRAAYGAKSVDNLQKVAPNSVEMSIDPLGVALIRGSVPTEADKANVAAHLLQMQGVTKIINQLTVDPSLVRSDAPTPSALADDQPPPPPQPVIVMPPDAAPNPATNPKQPPVPLAPKPNPPQTAVEREMRSKTDAVASPLKVRVRDGIATLSGSVPTVYEAMVAFRATERRPGVTHVVDMLQFVVPDGTAPNPLIEKAKPEDVEPYLLAQVRRNVGDAAHVERVRAVGKQLEVKGVLATADDRTRVEAILRSMPILRGFTLLPEFGVTDR